MLGTPPYVAQAGMACWGAGLSWGCGELPEDPPGEGDWVAATPHSKAGRGFPVPTLQTSSVGLERSW